MVDRLKELLVGIGPFRLNVIDGRGDSESQHDSYIDHGFHRAVEIRLFSQGQYHWKPKPVLRHGYAVVASDRFEFQAIESASASFSLFEADTMFFSIHDLTNRAIRYFSYRGVGATVPIPKTPVIGASAEHKSPAVPFRTLIKILDMKDFEGTASIEGNPGITAGKISVGGRVSMRLTPKAYEDRSIHNPLVINFSFSRGFGANIKNVGLGSVKMLSSSYRPTVYPY